MGADRAIRPADDRPYAALIFLNATLSEMQMARVTTSQTGATKTALTKMTAAAAVAAYAANPAMTPVIIADTPANVRTYLDSLQILAVAGKIASISLSGSGTMTITGKQFIADQTVLAFLPTTGSLVVTGVTAANAADVQGSVLVKTFTITDSSANVSAALDALNADTKLTVVRLTDTRPLTMSYNQFVTNKAILGKLPTGTKYSVSAVGAEAAQTMQATSAVAAFSVLDSVADVVAASAALLAATKLTSITVSDTAAQIAANLGALAGFAKLAAIVVTDTSVLTVTAGQYHTYRALLDKLPVSETLTVTGVSANEATTIAADAKVTSLTVSDTLANIGLALDALEVLAATGELKSIAVTDTGQSLTLSAEQYAADSHAIALLTGSFSVQQQAPAREPMPAVTVKPPVFNLIWDESVDLAPVGFREAVQYAANFFDSLITSPITVNVEIGYGEVRDVAMQAGNIGEAQINTALMRGFTDYKAALAAHNTSADIQTALNAMTNPGTGKSIFVAGAQAKALGLLAADAPALDAAVGFMADPNRTLFTYDPNNRAVDGKYDFIGLVQHELSHALGRLSYTWTTTGFDLYRYAAPSVRAVAGSTASYFSIDGGATNLAAFSTTGHYDDWSSTMGNDALNAYARSGVQNNFSETDVRLLNVLGYAISTPPVASSGGVALTDATIPASVGLQPSGAGFIAESWFPDVGSWQSAGLPSGSEPDLGGWMGAFGGDAGVLDGMVPVAAQEPPGMANPAYFACGNGDGPVLPGLRAVDFDRG